jgi:hypothetical protein
MWRWFERILVVIFKGEEPVTHGIDLSYIVRVDKIKIDRE